MRCYLFTSSCLLAAFVTILSHGVLVAGDEPTKTVVRVGVYYESLCGDSMRWIRDQLVANYEPLKNNLQITFVPYGKATHWRENETGPWHFTCQHGAVECRGNMAQSCAIDAIKNEESSEKIQDLSVALVGCAMASRYPPTAVPQCARDIGLNEKTQKSINDCMEGTKSKDLLAVNGDMTVALQPPLTFVPTITINDIKDKNTQNKAFNNFLQLICSHLSEAEKPSECSRGN